ncbi:hypothetical protein A6R68_04186 [Neotoma lepida]|uniref:Uncharacterized protein n=1 Tax=Neotoma lepida TaxID=56216 RepID=A0A1A6GLY9_NEOLE|nr:hypothetical protein A6R68_04186 [Neotoma lepida]
MLQHLLQCFLIERTLQHLNSFWHSFLRAQRSCYPSVIVLPTRHKPCLQISPGLLCESILPSFLGFLVGAVINYAGSTRAKTLHIISTKGLKGQLSSPLPENMDDMETATIKEGQKLREKVYPGVSQNDPVLIYDNWLQDAMKPKKEKQADLESQSMMISATMLMTLVSPEESHRQAGAEEGIWHY